MGTRLHVVFIVLSSLICSRAFAQKSVFWFEPDFSYSYYNHQLSYLDYFEHSYSFGDDIIPVHYESFYNRYARKASLRTITRNSVYVRSDSSNMDMKPNLKEIFGYDEKGYLISYKKFVLPQNKDGYEVRYKYSRNKRTIIATYHDVANFKNNSEYSKLVYHYNRKRQLSFKLVYPVQGAGKKTSFLYDEPWLLTTVEDSFFVNAHKAKRFSLTYDTIVDDKVVKEYLDALTYTYRVHFDSVSITSAYNVTSQYREDKSKRKVILKNGDFGYALFMDGDEHGWRPPKHTGQPSAPYQFLGTSRIQVYSWTPDKQMLERVFFANISSSSYGRDFLLEAKKSTKGGLWNINIQNRGLRLGGRYDIEHKANYVNETDAPITEFVYDKAKYTYEYEYY